MSRCQCTTHIGLGGFEMQCPNDAKFALVIGCVHEHIRDTFGCAACVKLNLAGEPVYCLQCRNSEPSHFCQITMLSYKPLAEVSA